MRQRYQYPLLFTLFLLPLIILSACTDTGVNETEPPPTAVGETELPTVTSPPPATETVAPTPTEEATAEPATATPEDEEPLSGLATVEQVSVTVSQEPLSVQAAVSGTLPDGCTEIDETTVEQEGNTFLVTITTTRDPDAVCTQALVPFKASVQLGADELEPGQYEVEVNGVSEPFTIPGGEPEPTQEPTPAPTVSITPQSGPAGTTVQLTAIGLPKSSTVQIGIGPPESEYEIIDQATTDGEGRLNIQTTVPDYVEAGEEWLFVVETDQDVIISEPFTVTAGQPGGGQAGTWNIYLIALEDAGQSGEEVGCGDSVIPVAVDVGPTVAPLRATLERLLSVNEEFYGQSGLYNALHQSNLQVQGIDIRNGTAIIHLTGELVLGGTCDAPRVEAQLEQTALQFSTVNAVEISINGTPLQELLSQQ